MRAAGGQSLVGGHSVGILTTGPALSTQGRQLPTRPPYSKEKDCFLSAVGSPKTATRWGGFCSLECYLFIDYFICTFIREET